MKANKFLWKNKAGYSNLIPLALAIVIVFALLFVGAYVNSTIHDSLNSATSDTQTQNTMNNISTNWDSTLSIVQVTIIITILAGAIGAIFLFTRFR